MKCILVSKRKIEGIMSALETRSSIFQRLFSWLPSMKFLENFTTSPIRYEARSETKNKLTLKIASLILEIPSILDSRKISLFLK